MVAPMGQTTLVADSVTTSGAQTNVIIAVYVDGRRFNSRTLQLINRAPIAAVKVGTNVKVRVISNGAVVEISGRVKSVDQNTNQIVVTTDTGATLVGYPASGGIVEVKL
jgi:molybdopterin biosynthesis enzyme